MKIGISSDTHGIKEYIDKAIFYLKDCDLIIHAGDNFSDSKYIYSMTKVGIMAVKGNCDFDNVEDELLFDLEDKMVFLCHGDKYNVKYGIDEIEEKAKNENADIVIFDPKASGFISKNTHHSKSDYTPYEGVHTKGRVDTVYLRGKLVVKNGEVVLENKGKYVKRSVSDLK